ncbi:4-(cytidine 5'-diphospho)-2-C-methyl-D-erythritol kinase [Hyphomicrobium sp.]|uniref:4-(cytidine 5'-diphospho)-2-C-methyl-D-erythritol kinase n=1 Tax=Hyphomicrobium sp. TaxID=82 RepID=UPI002CB065E0|nr:4-(cytidine 5'-diphospho)-2-C-methyl-D-erythritol kinase [Hyphomicrobium sp.]HVZ06146.1 4-(cytidine 5'-diphospho)-2-C-methyl-D-erythritol kinase [Hyphomicrobium sp.]
MSKPEFAPAKINLTLEILGRRPDGYHELRSLVAFARDVGDVLTCTPGPSPYAGVEMAGPFAGGISGANLVDKAVAAFTIKAPNAEPSRLRLEKYLPVASGIGGGSADAAAALRLLCANCSEASISNPDLLSIARQLGADVPVCLKSRPVIMTGIGEQLDDVRLPADLYAVLVNPGVSVPSDKTAQVFARLGAEALTSTPPREPALCFAEPQDVIAYATTRKNDLETPARRLFPVIDVMLYELNRLDGCRLARLSGAGPTCFALFDARQTAEVAAAALTERQPDWWIRATRLG